MGLKVLASLIVAASIVGQARTPRTPARRAPASWVSRLSDPRRLVPLILVSVVVVGSGRKLRQSWQARRAVDRLLSPDVSIAAIEATAQTGRLALAELFELQGTAKDQAVREAAGHALSVLWARDELIPEEEKSIVRRGFQVVWHARKRYPRAMRTEIPIVVDFGVPFLREDGNGVPPSQLRWSFRVEGARRVSLETFSGPAPGAGRASFSIVPGDFTMNGPHRLVLQTRVETVGLTDHWELDLPHIPFSFEFDPLLSIDALLALPDDSRAEAFAQSTRLVLERPEEPVFLTVNEGLAMRGVPSIELTTPLPCDLAHRIEVEIDEVEGWHFAGELILRGQGVSGDTTPASRRFPIGPFSPVLPTSLDRPGPYRLRARLVASPERGWADPDVRSIWPGTIETGWMEVELVRR